jgi:hypothetical protein
MRLKRISTPSRQERKGAQRRKPEKPSCSDLFRASLVDGRVKPGHDIDYRSLRILAFFALGFEKVFNAVGAEETRRNAEKNQQKSSCPDLFRASLIDGRVRPGHDIDYRSLRILAFFALGVEKVFNAVGAEETRRNAEKNQQKPSCPDLFRASTWLSRIFRRWPGQAQLIPHCNKLAMLTRIAKLFMSLI